MNHVELLSIESLIPYARNARTHSEAQIAQIAASIREFGFCNPVLIDNRDGIISGHGRILAARKLGLSDIPCVRLDHLTDNQRRAYIIADNKLALNATWDTGLLALEMEDLQALEFDLELTGFGAGELDSMRTPDFMPASEEEQGRLDQLEPIYVKCPECGAKFDYREQKG
jgi:ParB-like chromosome segregation protein Spo0J